MSANTTVMRKKVSECSTMEKFELFKESIEDIVTGIFRGQEHSQLEPIVFLGAKNEVIHKFGDEHPEFIESKDFEEYEVGSTPDPDKIGLIPVPITMATDKARSIAEQLPPFLAGPIMDHGMKQAKFMVDKVIETLSKYDMNGVQFYAHVAEAWVVSGKMTQEEKSKREIDGKPSEIEMEIDRLLSIGTHPKDIPGAQQQVVILFECQTETHVVHYDVVREDEYQVLVNKEEAVSNVVTEGRFAGFIHKESAPNMN